MNYPAGALARHLADRSLPAADSVLDDATRAGNEIFAALDDIAAKARDTSASIRSAAPDEVCDDLDNAADTWAQIERELTDALTNVAGWLGKRMVL
jgi:hypothetical protein